MANALNALPAIIAALGTSKQGRRNYGVGPGPTFARYNQELLIDAGATFNKHDRCWQLHTKMISKEIITFEGPELIHKFIRQAEPPTEPGEK